MRVHCGRLMSAEARMPINERANLVFQDSDIIPLFIQARSAHVVRLYHLCNALAATGELPELTSYVRRLRRNSAHGAFRRLRSKRGFNVMHCMQELVARASACIADGDVLTTAVRRHQVTGQRCTRALAVRLPALTCRDAALGSHALCCGHRLCPSNCHSAVRECDGRPCHA